MRAPLDSPTLVLTDHPAGTGRLLGTASRAQGKTPSWLEDFWLRLGGGASFVTEEIPGLLGGIGCGPAAVVHVRRAASSQYRNVRDHLAAGGRLERPLVCLADAGDGFSGQAGRVWRAEPGNLHLTLAVPCDLAVGPEAVALTALPAVAVHRALASLKPGPDLPHPGIKWVNDVLLNGGKVAGVLTAVRSQDGRLTSTILGIGLNVGVAPALPPSLFTPASVSLDSAWPVGAPTLDRVLKTLLEEIGRLFHSLIHEGPDPVLAAYREASLVVGRQVGIWPVDTPDGGEGHEGPPERTGIVTRILSDLSLELEGQAAPVTTGRAALLDGDRT